VNFGHHIELLSACFVPDNRFSVSFPGDTKGTPASVASDPIQDWYLSSGADFQRYEQHHERLALQLVTPLQPLENDTIDFRRLS
jgi:hypothetical protein